jgi:chromosome segregation ATPase
MSDILALRCDGNEQAEQALAALRAHVEELTRERDSADRGVTRNAEKAAEYFKRAEQAEAQAAADREGVKRYADKWRQAEARLVEAVRGLEEALALEDINREREKRGLPIIYNPTVLRAALAAARGEEGK